MTVSSRQERRKQRTTDTILDAAERSFATRGYAGATIEAICADADVAIGSIYARFAGKEQLYLALVERFVQINERYVAEALATGASPWERVLAVGEAYLRFHRDHPTAFRVIGLRDLPATPDHRRTDVRRQVQQRLRGMLDRVAATIDEAAATGEIRAVDARATATFLWGAWNGAIALHLQGAIDASALAATVTVGSDLITRGLGEGRAEPERPGSFIRTGRSPTSPDPAPAARAAPLFGSWSRRPC